MGKITRTTLIIILSVLLSSPLFSSNLLNKIMKDSKDNQSTSDESIKSKYNIEETTEILKSRKLGKIRLDHDDHVYKFMKVAKNANNLEGAVDVLIASKTKLGYTLDDSEVDVLIKISNLDTNLYQEIIVIARKLGKSKTTVREHFTICNELKKGNGKYILAGIERAIGCNYKIKNDYFSWSRLNLLIQVGKITDEDRFVDIYNAMRSIGMGSKVDPKGLEVLYKLYHVKGDVAGKITEYLKYNKWRSRKQPGDREYIVIRDLIKANYKILGQESNFDNPTDMKITKITPKPVVKKSKKRSEKMARKRTYAKNKNHKKKNKSFNPCSAFISKK